MTPWKNTAAPDFTPASIASQGTRSGNIDMVIMDLRMPLGVNESSASSCMPNLMKAVELFVNNTFMDGLQLEERERLLLSYICEEDGALGGSILIDSRFVDRRNKWTAYRRAQLALKRIANKLEDEALDCERLVACIGEMIRNTGDFDSLSITLISFYRDVVNAEFHGGQKLPKAMDDLVEAYNGKLKVSFINALISITGAEEQLYRSHGDTMLISTSQESFSLLLKNVFARVVASKGIIRLRETESRGWKPSNTLNTEKMTNLVLHVTCSVRPTVFDADLPSFALKPHLVFDVVRKVSSNSISELCLYGTPHLVHASKVCGSSEGHICTLGKVMMEREETLILLEQYSLTYFALFAFRESRGQLMLRTIASRETLYPFFVNNVAGSPEKEASSGPLVESIVKTFKKTAYNPIDLHGVKDRNIIRLAGASRDSKLPASQQQFEHQSENGSRIQTRRKGRHGVGPGAKKVSFATVRNNQS